MPTRIQMISGGWLVVATDYEATRDALRDASGRFAEFEEDGHSVSVNVEQVQSIEPTNVTPRGITF